jgi:hypothetical protein
MGQAFSPVVTRCSMGCACLALLASTGCLYVNIDRSGGHSGMRHVQVGTLMPGSLSETVGSDFLTTWHAAQSALTDLNLNVVAESRNTHSGSIECLTTSNERIHLVFDGQNPQQTTVNVRWTTPTDVAVSGQLMERISTRAGTPVAHAPGSPVAVAPAGP